MQHSLAIVVRRQLFVLQLLAISSVCAALGLFTQTPFEFPILWQAGVVAYSIPSPVVLNIVPLICIIFLLLRKASAEHPQSANDGWLFIWLILGAALVIGFLLVATLLRVTVALTALIVCRWIIIWLLGLLQIVRRLSFQSNYGIRSEATLRSHVVWDIVHTEFATIASLGAIVALAVANFGFVAPLHAVLGAVVWTMLTVLWLVIRYDNLHRNATIKAGARPKL